MPISQKKRFAKVTSPLGADALVLRRLRLTEHLSRPFTIELDLLSEDTDVGLDDVLGKVMTVTLELPGGGRRLYSGYATRFAAAGAEGHTSRYEAVLRPWLWFLTRKADCRIFQDKTVPDILKEIFREAGFSDFKDSLSGTYRTWNYCVQYRESDFDFASRLMEQEGIYYFFRHEDGKNHLVLADGYGAHAPASGYSEVPFLPLGEAADEDHERVFEWKIAREVQTGCAAITSFDFEKPGTNLAAKSKIARGHALADHEAYDYPADYVESKDGDAYAEIRIQERQAPFETASGRASARGLSAGSLFTLKDHPRKDQNREYLLLGTEEEIVSDAFESGEKGETSYACSFTAVPGQTPWRPPRVTPRPRTTGPQTAIVVGKKGEEIWTDKYGRVKVQFHWDRKGKQDENSTCWIRVAQIWSGGTFGGIHVPRIGEEVIVDFVEGDPDRPIITGRVYNGKNMPPYGLPANQTQLGIKTRSSPGGSGDNFNELRFEDRRDAEEIYFHAEKDFNRVVENNDTLKVGFEKKDAGDQTIDIYNHRTTTIEQGNDTLNINGGNRATTIEKGDDTLTIRNGKRITTVFGDQTLDLQKGDRSATIQMGNDALRLVMGNLSIKCDLGKIEIEALQSIELKVGQSRVKIDQMGVEVNGMMIRETAEMIHQKRAMIVRENGSAMVEVGGGLIMIG